MIYRYSNERCPIYCIGPSCKNFNIFVFNADGRLIVFLNSNFSLTKKPIFFALLSIDVNRNKIKKIEGEDSGSPENPKILKKFIYTTIISSLIFLILYYLVQYNYLNLRNFLM